METGERGRVDKRQGNRSEANLTLLNRILIFFLLTVALTLQGPISNPSVKGRATFNRGVVEVPGILNRQLQVRVFEKDMPDVYTCI